MDTMPVLDSLRHASSLLRNADSELFRPEEDSVTLCACHSIKTATAGYLKSFLAENEASNSSNSLEVLLSECLKLDSAFNIVDISCFLCKTEEGGETYCLEPKNVSECLTQAKSIEGIVLDSLKISRADLITG